MEEENNSDNFNSTRVGGTESQKRSLSLWTIYGSILLGLLILTAVFLAINKKDTIKIKDYSSDVEGFVMAAKDCEPSKVRWNISVEIMGLRSDTLYELKLKGIENGTCSFYMEIINYTDFGPIDQSPPSELFRGLNKTCNIPIEMVNQEFEYWKSGSPRAFSNSSYCTQFEQRVISNQQINAQNQQTNTNSANCIENWSCGSWNLCVEAQTYETRLCSDTNNCGTITNKPQDSRPCQAQGVDNINNCTDSDGGKDYFTKGRTIGFDWFTNGQVDAEDDCFGYQVREYYCENGNIKVDIVPCPEGKQCYNDVCQQARDCKAFMGDTCLEYYEMDYNGCSTKSDCTVQCQNCTGGTQNCMDLGRISTYSNYSHYYVCGECNNFRYPDGGQCKEGYECDSFSEKCEPNEETRCKTDTCPECITGLRKWISGQTWGSCYDCDTNQDCKSGNCTLGECAPL